MQETLFPKLYKRASNGGIRNWNIKVIDNRIERSSGQLFGKYINTTDIITEGKNIGRSNETTVNEQAISEARAYFNKKKDEGYKTLEDLGCALENLNEALPKFNTDAQGNIKPMLAKAVDWGKVKYPAFIQPKYDGVRCLMIIRDGEILFLSRSGKYYTTLEHIADVIPESIRKHDIILDGEVYNDSMTFQELVSAVKKQGPNTTKLYFRLYDVVNDNPQWSRISKIEDIKLIVGSPLVQLAPTLRIKSREEAKILHDEWVASGHEGAMIRDINGFYDQGKRSSSLRKVKEFDEAEFMCTSLELGKREEDVIAVCMTDTKVFRAKLVGTREEKAEIMENFTGPRWLTVKFFGWTEDKIPRFPIGKTFRDYE